KSILIVFVLTLIGTFCKEQASTTLIVCIFHESLFKYNLRSKILQNTDRWVNWVKSNFNLRNITNSNGKQSNCKLSSSSSSMVPQSKSSCAFYANIFYFSMGFMTISCLRFAIMNNKLPSFNRLDNPARILTSPYRQLNYAFIWSYNCWLLLYPVNLSCDWSSTSIQLIVSLIDPKNILTLLLFISLTVILLKGDTITWMAMGFMVITFLPVSNIFFPVGFVIAERVLYLPSMGFSMILARGFILLYSSIIIKSKRWIQLTFYLLTIVFLSSLTIKTTHRCSEWKNELSLFTSGLNVNPGNVKLLNNVGRLYEDQGNLALALSYYEKSVTIEPDDVRGYLNLGKALTKIGRLPEAEMFYRKALDLIPKSSRSTSPLKNSNDISENIDPLPVDKLSANSYLAPSSSVSSLIADKPIEQQNTDQSKIIGRLSFPVYERLVNQGTNTDHNDYTLIDYNDAVNESKTTTTITTDNNLSSSITLNHLQGLLNYASLISRDESRLDEANRMFLTIASLRPDYSATYSTWIQSMINAGSVNNNKNHNDNDNDATTINGNQFNDETILSQFTLNNKQTDPNILYNMAILFNNNGNLENALNLFDQILKIDPYHQETLSTSARIIKDNELIGDYLTIAIERLETLVSMGKADETVYFDLGMLSIRSGSMATARKHFAKAIELKPNFTEALFNMALLLYKEDQPQDALPFLKFILKTERTHGKALLLMLAINSSTNEVDDQSGSLKVQQLPSSSSPESKEFFGAQSNSNTFYT
ncbi:protein O-mannosyl-transferase Tmtc3-like, partial [Panonychus citri]|uniref:protein O-mannosyl-transferase Tmtc3-like n=1 Tax=Panonychus citri TaxID=50023 RepID=UPI002308126E